MSTMEELIEEASRTAEQCMKRKRFVPQFVLAQRADGERRTFVTPDLPKDLLVDLIQVFLALHDIERYVLVTEAWQTEHRDADSEACKLAVQLAAENRLREHPDRIEVVMFSAEDRQAGMLTAARRIVRGHRYRPTLGPLNVDKRRMESAGRMVGLLPKRENERVN